jgi:PAS domain S-box-containing protein
MVLLAWLLSVVAAQGQKSTKANLPTLTHVEQIREMTIEEAGRGYPVRIRGVVTYYNWDAGDLFIQDSTAGIWVNRGETKLALHHGEFVQVEGFSNAGDVAPEIDHAHFRSLGEAPMPNPWRPTSDELASGKQDSQWIELQGVVRSVAEREGGLVLNLSSGAFECIVFVLKYPSLPTDIVDSQVRIRGVFAGLYDPSSNRFIGFHVLTPSWADVKVLKRPTQALWSVPVRPTHLFLRLTPEGAFTHRVHVRGVVTLQQLGRFLCVRDSEGALLVNTPQPTPLKVGDLIDAMGFPAIGDYTVIMRDAIFRRVGAGPAPEPVAVSPEKLRAGNHNADLVRLSARLLSCTTRPREEVLDLQAGEVTFRAVLNTGTNSSPLGSLRAGSLLQLTGVSIVEADKNHQAEGFEILLQSPADVVVLELPPWWTPGRLLRVLGLLAVAVILALGWITALRRRVRQQTETLRLKYERELALEEQYHDLFENSPVGIYRTTADGRILAGNPAFAQMLGYSSCEELASRNLNAPDFEPQYSRGQITEKLEKEGRITGLESQWHWRDGRVIFVRENARAIQDEAGQILYYEGTAEDITERKRAEEGLRRLNRELKAISSCNQTLLRAVDEQALLNDICRIICGEAGYRLAWVGYADNDAAKTIRPVAWAGFESGYIASAKLSWAEDTDRGRGPAGIAIRGGKSVCVQDVATDPIMAPWRENALQRGYRSGMALPLKDENANVFGVLMIYSAEANAITPDEMRLMEGLAGDLAFGITVLRTRIERKRAEEASRDSEQFNREVIANAQEGVAVYDREFRYQLWNRFMEELTGLPASEALGKRAFDLFPHLREQKVDLLIRRALAGEVVHAPDVPFRVPTTGKSGWVSAVYGPHFGASGQIHGVIGTIRDITERKRVEEAFRESEEHFRKFIENVLLGVYQTTPNGRVLMANPALLRMLGYDSWQELASRNLEDEGFEAGRPRSAFREQIEREGEVGGLEVAWKKRDGSVVFVRESARAFRADDGRVLYYDGIVEDVTEHRRLEEQLRQAQKMEAIGRLAGGVAHDFNNLLTIIIGYSDLLLEKLSACDGRRLHVEEIKKAGERATSLTRQLLAFSRKQVLQLQILDLDSLLTNVGEMLRRVIGEDIELVTRLPSGLGHVKVDAGQIEQVIMNLAVNARDAMPQGGQLTLEAANVELDSSYVSSQESVLPGHYVMIAVSDTGIGMDAETQAHIFEPFFTTKEQGKGTGLGLATVHGIVKQSEGHIWVYSEPGKGTTFKVCLPRIDQAVEVIAPTDVPVDELSRGSETILLVEDEDAVCSLVKEVLESSGYEVLEAKGAHEALEVGERHKKHIHLLLTDVVMPHMSGRELAEHLAPLHPETKVLYMSGYADHAVLHHSLLDPGTALLQKPFTAEALARKLREVLDSARA